MGMKKNKRHEDVLPDYGTCEQCSRRKDCKLYMDNGFNHTVCCSDFKAVERKRRYEY